MGKIIIIGLGLVLASIGGIIGARGRDADEKTVNSEMLHKEMNRELIKGRKA